MKKFSFLFLIIILFLFVFAVSNLYLKKKNNISYQIFFHEPCFLSKNISNKISSYGYDNELFYKFWRKPGYHCKSSFRESNYVFVFKDEQRKKQFINKVKSSEFIESLRDIIYTNKNANILILNEINAMIDILDTKNDLKNSVKYNLTSQKESIEKQLVDINQTIIAIEDGNSIFEIVRIKKIDDIKNFNLKLSIYITSYLIIFTLIISYIFRKKQLGFYR